MISARWRRNKVKIHNMCFMYILIDCRTSIVPQVKSNAVCVKKTSVSTQKYWHLILIFVPHALGKREIFPRSIISLINWIIPCMMKSGQLMKSYSCLKGFKSRWLYIKFRHGFGNWSEIV